jgi:hypothetical protein
VDVSFRASDELRPWNGIYGIAMVIDDKDPGRGGLEIGYLETNPGRIFFDCGQELGPGLLGPGRYTVRYSGGVASFDAPVVTTNTVTIDVDCAKALGDASTARPAEPEPLAASTSPTGCAAGGRSTSDGSLAPLVFGALAIVIRRRARKTAGVTALRALGAIARR